MSDGDSTWWSFTYPKQAEVPAWPAHIAELQRAVMDLQGRIHLNRERIAALERALAKAQDDIRDLTDIAEGRDA